MQLALFLDDGWLIECIYENFLALAKIIATV